MDNLEKWLEEILWEKKLDDLPIEIIRFKSFVVDKISGKNTVYQGVREMVILIIIIFILMI